MTSYPKDRARRLVRSRLRSVASTDFQAQSHVAYDHLLSILNHLQKKHSVNTVLSYKPLVKWHEVDVSPLKKDFPKLRFDYAPSSASGFLPATQFDCVLVPLYGFDRQGYRLGHGGGWYDRLLAMQPQAIKIGIGLESGRIDFVVEDHDTPMDIIVTETQPEILRKRNLFELSPQ